MSCGVGCRHGSDPAWLWCRPAAVDPIQPLAWERPCALGVALNIKAKKKKKKKKKTEVCLAGAVGVGGGSSQPISRDMGDAKANIKPSLLTSTVFLYR